MYPHITTLGAAHSTSSATSRSSRFRFFALAHVCPHVIVGHLRHGKLLLLLHGYAPVRMNGLDGREGRRAPYCDETVARASTHHRSRVEPKPPLRSMRSRYRYVIRLPKRTEYRAVLVPRRGRPNSPCSTISSMGNRLPSGQWTTSGSIRPSSVTRTSMPTYCFQDRFAGMCRSLCRMPFIIEHRFVSRNRARKNGERVSGIIVIPDTKKRIANRISVFDETELNRGNRL